MLIAIAIMLFFTGSATFTNNVNKNFSKVTTPIKFLPIAVVIILGITFGSIYSEHNLFIHPGEIFDTNKPASGNSNFDMNGVFVSLPPILFALDSFLIVGNIASDVKNAKKNVPLSILISMILSGTVYLLTTIGQIFTGCGNVYQLIQFIFDKGQETDVISTATRVCTIIVSTFVLISILGVNNSLSMAMVFSAQAVVDEEIIIGSTTLKRWGNGHKHLAGFYAT
jgi:APA family basic amino acid/polyamine antiporter